MFPSKLIPAINLQITKFSFATPKPCSQCLSLSPLSIATGLGILCKLPTKVLSFSTCLQFSYRTNLSRVIKKVNVLILHVTVNLSLAKSSSFDNLSYLVCRRHIYSLMLVCYSIMHGCSVKSATHRINGLLLTEQSVSMIIINQALMNICAI